jgi:hypothetical protein
MLESKSIWMSNIRYQNDAEEYQYMYTVFKKVVAEEYPGFDYKQLFRDEEVLQAFVPSVFTFSLTENKDLLSQWRGYCPNGGYSFEFDRKQLDAFVRRFRIIVRKCVYDEEEQRKIIREQVIQFSPQEWIDVYKAGRNTDSPFMYGLKYMESRLAALAPLVKHPAFKEEAEWRLIKDFEGSGPDYRPIEQHPAFEYSKTRPTLEMIDEGKCLNFREDKGILVPYLSLPFVAPEDLHQSVRLNEVVIAPGSRQQLAKPACEAMLKSWGTGCPVNLSAAPYRV